MLNQEIIDKPGKAQVSLDILIEGDVSESSLRDLLNSLHSRLSRRSGFQYHKYPTVIAVYAYTSRERFESGMGEWIAMLSKTPGEDRHSILINERQFAGLKAEVVEKFGLSEDQQRAVWQKLVVADRRTYAEAEREYPFDPTQVFERGDVFELSRSTPIAKKRSYDNPLEGLAALYRLPVGTRIQIIETDISGTGIRWYFVEATSSAGAQIGRGWINSVALMNQADVDAREQMVKRAARQTELDAIYDRQIADQYGLTLEQLEEISTTGIMHDWPSPPYAEY